MKGPFCGGMNFSPSHTSETSRSSQASFRRRSHFGFFFGGGVAIYRKVDEDKFALLCAQLGLALSWHKLWG